MFCESGVYPSLLKNCKTIHRYRFAKRMYSSPTLEIILVANVRSLLKLVKYLVWFVNWCTVVVSNEKLTSWVPSLFLIPIFFQLFVACRLCVIYVWEDFNVQAMMTWLMWTSLFAVQEKPLNLITHSLRPHPLHPPKKTNLINPPLSPSFPHPITPLSSQSPTHHAQIPTLPETISPFPHHCSTPLISLLPITPSLDHSPISHSSLSLLCCPLSLSPHLSLIHTWPTQFCTHSWPSH